MISLQTKVWQAVNAIDIDGVSPVLDPGDGFIYVLNTSSKVLGNIIYTVYSKHTLFPESSWQVRYGSYHVVHQMLYEPLPMRSKLDYIVDIDIPDMEREEFDPLILPMQGVIYPTSF